MTLPEAKNLSHHLSEEAKSRQPSKLKQAFKYFSQPGMTYLGGGLPLAAYFPFDKIVADCPTAPFANGNGAQITDEDKTEIVIYKDKSKNSKEFGDIELSRSLQYGHTEGQPELLDFLKEHTQTIHRIPYLDWSLILTIGNTQLWDSTLRTFTNRGDTILVEEHTFTSAMETSRALGVTNFPVQMDAFGVIPEAFETLLDNWVGAKPKFFYTICTGQNPTGSCIGGDRRRAIYKICQKHDLLIIEDEPYYFLQMEPYTRDTALRGKRHVHDHDEFLKALVPSYLSMDVDGRVIRLDSVSKTLAPGSRLGWIVGQSALIERYLRLHEVSMQAPSGFTCSIMNGLLQRWGQKGYLDWLIGLRGEYTHKRDVAIDAFYDYFPQEVASTLAPLAGMFFVVYLDVSKHPKFKELGEDPLKVEELVYEKAIEFGSLMVPGSYFKADGETNPPQPPVPTDAEHEHTIFFRGTYAAVPLDALVLGMEKFGKAVKAEFGLE